MWLHHRGEIVVGAQRICLLQSFAAAIIKRKDRIGEAWPTVLGTAQGG